MKKTKALSQNQTLPAIVDRPHPLGHLFEVRKDKLVLHPGLPEDAKPIPKPFKTEEEFAKLIFGNRAILFGERTIGLSCNAITRVFQQNYFLFDFTNENAPRFYLLAVKLGKGGKFYEEFYPLMTKLFVLMRDAGNLMELVKALDDKITKDKKMYAAIKNLLPKGLALDDMLLQTLFKAPKCLLVTEDPLDELRDLTIAYAETWGGMLDITYVRKYQIGKSTMISMHPALSELGIKPKEKKPREPKVEHTEDHHLSKGTDVIRGVYEKLKSQALKMDKTVFFNHFGKHYIGMRKGSGKNLAIFHFRKSTLYVVVMLELKIVRKMLKHFEILELKPSVKKFWNGECCAVNIRSAEHLKEFIEVLKKLIK